MPRAKEKFRGAVELRIDPLFKRKGVELHSVGNVLTYVARQIRERRLLAVKLLAKRRPQPADYPRLQTQLSPQDFDFNRIEYADGHDEYNKEQGTAQ